MPAPRPNAIKTSHLKSRILNIAQTSVYQVKIQPPPAVNAFLSARGFNYGIDGENLELMCSEASLPGTFLRTHTQENDYHGVTEKMVYRRDYDETFNMTFYVDRKYNVIKFFDDWVDYIVGQSNPRAYKNTVANYRMKYPDTYRGEMFISKFEKDVYGPSLNYTFIGAFPINITSMPVSYDGSDLLKCNVGFSYIRYIRETGTVFEGDIPDIKLQSIFNGPGPVYQSAGAGQDQGVTRRYPRTEYTRPGARPSSLNSLTGSDNPYYSDAGIPKLIRSSGASFTNPMTPGFGNA